ncbi:MAG: hypothetical protein INQ03_25640 [Candidatus Heimdallarchaeota archaeon]|nr:hypothetical protein [Candidatus Heimdallarchaeota archaeon]
MRKYLGLLFTLFLIIQPIQVHSYTEINFTLIYLMEEGNDLDMHYASFLNESLFDLGIGITIKTVSPEAYEFTLLNSHEYDLAVTRLQNNKITGLEAGISELTSVHQEVPILYPRYASTSDLGKNLYQLNDPDWQAWQSEDIGYTQSEIDEIIQIIDTASPVEEKYDVLETFTSFYFENLLYDLPLTVTTARLKVLTGYGGPNNELWDPMEGIIRSRMLGAYWETMPQERIYNATHLNIPSEYPGKLDFNHLTTGEPTSNIIGQLLMDSLLQIDRNGDIHPGLAWNVLRQETNTTVEYCFLLRDDAYWTDTVSVYGEFIKGERLDAKDFEVMLDDYSGALKEKIDYNTSSTIFDEDTLHIFLDKKFSNENDLLELGKLKPFPSHILMRDYVEYQERLNHWGTLTGYSSVGPYSILKSTENGLSFSSRPDYYFPNEVDVQRYYNDTLLETLELRFNTTLNSFNPSVLPNNNSHYWSTKTLNSNPSTQGIDTIDILWYYDEEQKLNDFNSGKLDVIVDWSEEPQFSTGYDDYSYIVKTIIPNLSYEMLIYNRLNDHLKKINIRKAISYALNYHTLIETDITAPGTMIPWYCITYSYHGQYSAIWEERVYSLERARDLMRIEGYLFNTVYSTLPIPQTLITTAQSSTGAASLHILSIVGALIWCMVKKHRGHNKY